MAITFDPENKIINLDSFTVSTNQLWTAFVDWSVLGDNLKYGSILRQLGGQVPVALYIFLQNGWRVRPRESNGVTTISGNLIVEEGGNPIAPTLGNFQVLVNLETPIQATAISVNGSGGVVDNSLLTSLIQSIKDKTDNMVFTKENELDVNQLSINNSKVYGSGSDNDKWRGTS
jgi:hypothetical protein